MEKILKLLKKQFPKIISVFFVVILFLGYVNTSATFIPGLTFDPSCAPGDTSCFVSKIDKLVAVRPSSTSTQKTLSNTYVPGSTVDPSCGPGDANCYITKIRKIISSGVATLSTPTSNSSPIKIFSNSSDREIRTLLLEMLRDPSVVEQLKGPKGDKGDAPSFNSNPSSNAPIPITYIPVGVVQPNPSTNFAGATFLNSINLSSTYFNTSEATISNILNTNTLNVSGNSTITGNLTISGILTPSSLVGTNITGVAPSLTSGITNALNSATTVVNVSNSTAPTVGQVLIATDSTHATWQTIAPGGVTSVTGTANRITATGGATPVLDISALYVGQTSITTLGTITSGTWNGSTINQAYLGTGGGGSTKFLREDNTWQTISIPSSEVPLTFSTGLTRSVNTITNNLSVGVSGGQTVVGGTAITDILSLKGTTGNGTLTSPAINMLVGNNGATNAMTVLNNGNVGIGTTNPDVKLNIVNGDFKMNSYSDNSGDGGSYWQQYFRSRGTESSPTAVQTNDEIGVLSARGYDGSFYRHLAQIRFSVDGTPGSADMPGRISFLTSLDNTGSPQERLRITNAGNIGIGLTSPTAYLHIKAGTATANTAPLKFTSGTLNTTAEAGAVEFLTDAYYGTITTGAARKQFLFTDGSAANLTSFPTLNQNTTGTASGLSTILVSTSGGSGVNNAGTLTWGAGGTLGTAAYTASSDYEVPLTFSTGLTRSVNTITNNLSVGVSGGQTVVGGTAITDILSLKGTTGNGTLTSPAINMLVGNNGATNAMTVLNNGNVGFSITPVAAVNLANKLFNFGTQTTNGSVELIINPNGLGTAYFGAGGSNTLHIIANGTNRMTILGGGNVGIGTVTPTGKLHITQTATATGALTGIVYTGAVNTNQTLSTEIPSLTLTTAGREWATGALTTQREVLITQPTYSFVGASTITDAATVGIAGAPIKSTNATITNTHGLLIQAGAVSTATNSYGLTVNAQTGATNNYAAAFLGGNVGIGTTAPTTLLELGSSDLGNGTAGPTFTLGRNTNATNTGAGSINFIGKAGTAGYVWQDAAGNMRIHTAAPSNANDVAGTVIGAQTSTRDTKQDITDYTDYSNALDMVVKMPLHTFRYIKEVEGYGTDSPLSKARIGYIADEVDPIFMTGNSIDQVSVNGILLASIKEMNLKLASVPKFDNISFAKKVANFLKAIGEQGLAIVDKLRTKELCVQKSDGTDVCVNGDQLDRLINAQAVVPVNYPAPVIPEPTPDIIPTPVIPEPTPPPTPTPILDPGVSPAPVIPEPTPDVIPAPAPGPIL